jgi:hypothetical protein
MPKYQRVKLSKAKTFKSKIGKFIRYKKLSRVIFGKINSRIQTLTLIIYLYVIPTVIKSTIIKNNLRI